MALTMKALAEKDKAVSLVWANTALKVLQDLDKWLKSKGSPAAIDRKLLPSHLPKVIDALETHFHIGTAASQSLLVGSIVSIYKDVIAILNASGTRFVDDTTSPEVAKGTIAHCPYDDGKSANVNFTPHFKEWDSTTGTGFGPFCRAAMVLHEPVHIVDFPMASQKINHVYEHDPRYKLLTASQAVHNASSYACFAQQMNFGSDTRFGAGKPQF